MPTVADLQKELTAEINALETRFLSRWIPAQPSHFPDDFQHDVKAYCVLAHAAFEEFVEDLSLAALTAAKNAWSSKKFSVSTVSLLLSYGGLVTASEDEETSQDRIFDQVRKAIDDCVDRHSKILANNHGYSLKYLRKILTPIGVDIPADIRLMASLRELADARGSYAHSQAKRAMYGEWKRADRPMAPEKAKTAVGDCLDLCKQLAGEVHKICVA